MKGKKKIYKIIRNAAFAVLSIFTALNFVRDSAETFHVEDTLWNFVVNNPEVVYLIILNLIGLFSIGVIFWIGMFFGKRNKGETIYEIKQKEKIAKAVYIFSPQLHYDLNDKEFKQIIETNWDKKVNQTLYKYLIPDDKKNLAIEYQLKYKLSDQTREKCFTYYKSIGMISKFLNEMVIYIMPDNSVHCYSYSASRNENLDVLEYDRQSADLFLSYFKSIIEENTK